MDEAHLRGRLLVAEDGFTCYICRRGYYHTLPPEELLGRERAIIAIEERMDEKHEEEEEEEEEEEQEEERAGSVEFVPAYYSPCQ